MTLSVPPVQLNWPVWGNDKVPTVSVPPERVSWAWSATERSVMEATPAEIRSEAVLGVLLLAPTNMEP